MKDSRRSIPSVDRLLASDAFAALQREWPRNVVVGALQRELAAVRSQAASVDAVHIDPDALAERVRSAIEDLADGTLLPVINATGVILHTNLGRAPLAQAALDAIQTAASGYSTLEYDVATGSRGSRYVHCRDLLCRLTGAEDALVVNNNAAALVLALNTFARGLEAVVSRGELVEIGGAFRVPDIMARSGAHLREVGATNRTHIADYRDAVSERTGALLKVHPSNFMMSGYTAQAGVEELAGLARTADVPLIHDIGSGLLIPPAHLGLPADEPTPAESLAAGAGIVTMSGDKLLGGPQSGIVLGSADLLERMRRNPLCRALRVDKLTLAALAATLRLYLDPDRAFREVPVLRMLTMDQAALESRAQRLTAECVQLGLEAETVAGSSAVGGGAAANAAIPTHIVLIGGTGAQARDLERRLRAGQPAVIARMIDDRTALDVRTIAPEDDNVLVTAIAAAAAPIAGRG